ncbi:MAG: glycogen-binding domain-containing protein [Phycisphaerales bacterium]|jgi:hypothetical protein
MITVDPSGLVRFRIYLPHAQRVEVVGSFTDWSRQPVLMKRVPPGWWEIEFPLPVGNHQFCYMVDESIFVADYGAHGVSMDRSGRWLSAVKVTTSTEPPIEVKTLGRTRPERGGELPGETRTSVPGRAMAG